MPRRFSRDESGEFARHGKKNKSNKNDSVMEKKFQEDEFSYYDNDNKQEPNYMSLADEELIELERSLKKNILKEKNENKRKEAEIELCYAQREIQFRKLQRKDFN